MKKNLKEYLIGRYSNFNYTCLASDYQRVQNFGTERNTAIVRASSFNEAIDLAAEQYPYLFPIKLEFEPSTRGEQKVYVTKTHYPDGWRGFFYAVHEWKGKYLY
jgi:hypothetical protein